jgi:fibro-slime domain-containing protein
VFINGQLVIDLGGVHSTVEQYVDLNRLGMADGEIYSLDFFFAERHRTESNFRITTNLPLVSTPVLTVSAVFD